MKLFSSTIAALLLSAASANAITLETTYAGGNSQDGIMFDIIVGSTAISLSSVDIHMDAGTTDLEFYIKSGTHVGSENNSGDWTLIDSLNGFTTSGPGNASNWDIADYLFGANQTYGLYVTAKSNPNVRYSNAAGPVGSLLASDANLSILTGTGMAYPFSSTFTPRDFNGALNYSLAPIPLPATLPLLFAGLMGLGFFRRRRNAS